MDILRHCASHWDSSPSSHVTKTVIPCSIIFIYLPPFSGFVSSTNFHMKIKTNFTRKGPESDREDT